jgi:hypothetical protein
LKWTRQRYLFPVFHSEPESAVHGVVRRKQLSLQLHIIQFAQFAGGPPAFADWLGRHGCQDFRFEFANPDLEP